ncbi:MAG: nicotinate phosphoribosyltransferase [Candidatus Caldatribacteriaceae bacterium]
MKKTWISTLQEVETFHVEKGRKFFSATHEEIAKGYTTDVYFVSAQEILRYLKLDDTMVVAEIFPRRSGILCGVEEALHLLEESEIEVWSLQEGEKFEPKEVVMRIKGPYSQFGIFETPLLGILAHSSGWATAARECKQAAQGKTIISFGARHVHPAVAPVMERAALIGGADGAACILGAKLVNKDPGGTIPHAVILIVGDTVVTAKAFIETIPAKFPRIILVDTFKDEAEETLRVAQFLKENLDGVRLDTPDERGGVTVALVEEVRERLRQSGFERVKIVVSGGLNPERIALLRDKVDIFGVGSYISGHPPIDMTMDIKEVAGQKVAKRGRIPGMIPNPRLKKVK